MGGRPGSTYGAQELATSVYDSPIATNNPASAATYTSSVYSPDEPSNEASAPPGPYSSQQHPQQSQYQSYNPNSQAAPPAPTGQAPAPPQSVMTPPPLQPGNAASYDVRHNLPSHGGPPQYKPYVPPGDGPSAPAPDSYYTNNY